MSNAIEYRTPLMFEKLTETYERLSALPTGKTLLAAYYDESPAAYEELFDEIMPCSKGWFKPERNRSYLLQHDSWGYINSREMPDSHFLFDHGFLLRRRGVRGITTWNNAGLVGLPYGMPRKELDGIHWLKNRDVTVWARPDLSLWCPGLTCLVIAAKALSNIDANAYGFESLT
jgi:hypothetical protein